MSPSLIFILTSVVPSLLIKFDISLILLRSWVLNSISEIGLLNISLRDTIFLTFSLLNLLLFSATFLIKVNINELPSANIFLFNSKISEKINNSNTLVKSVSLIIA